MRGNPRNDASENYRQGIQAYRQGNYAEAIELLGDCSREGNLQSRIAKYYHAMANRHLGVEALRQGKYIPAQSHLRTALRTLGPQADLSTYLACLYTKTHRVGQGAAELDKAVTAGEGDAAMLRRLALAQWQSGQREQAYLTLSAAVRKYRQEPSLHLQLGMFYAAEEQYDQARPHVEQATLLDSGDADARYALALIHSARGDSPAALRSMQRALELRSGDLLIAYQLSLAASAAQQSGQEVVLRIPDSHQVPGDETRNGHIAELIAAEPEFVEAFLELPQSAADEELFDMLAGAVKMALAEHPSYADLHYQCGRLLDRLGRRPEAMEHLRVALRLNARYVKAHLALAKMQSQENMLDEAHEHVQAAIACGADWPDVHCLAGEILCRRGRRDRGREHLERALKLNSNYRRAAEALERAAA